MKDTILVTGGAGFIGSNFIRFALNRDIFEIINLDALNYAGNLENLREIEDSVDYHFVRGKIQNAELVDFLIKKYRVKGIINFAAETHVDRSILDASPFVDTNIGGTLTLLQAALNNKIERYLQVSTDEVYGSLGSEGKFTEESPITPNSPYSASKAAADHFVLAYHHTFKLPVVVTRCSNNYGKYQFPEKLIPLMILNAIEDKKLPVYGDGLNVRDWIHVEDHCSGILAAFEKGGSGEVYNLGGNCEKTNIVIVRSILKLLDKPDSLIQYVTDRPGHDRRYAIDSAKIESRLGWKPEKNFDSALAETVEWYRDNPDWSARVRSGAYKEYYLKQYGKIDE
ncbi:MAG: dTDP-glucose 4,6-dehydratase [Bacteroidota bacterium]|nr:dTDP-glucose 4,6-dehydratase [Bacteroidota bacterium]